MSKLGTCLLAIDPGSISQLVAAGAVLLHARDATFPNQVLIPGSGATADTQTTVTHDAAVVAAGQPPGCRSCIGQDRPSIINPGSHDASPIAGLVLQSRDTL